MKEEIKEWIEKAEHDLNTAKVNLNAYIYDAAAFFCQQAVEKALKALYIKKFGKLLKVHDLHLLGKKVNAPPDVLDVCNELTTFYVASRYPESYTKFEKESFICHSKS